MVLWICLKKIQQVSSLVISGKELKKEDNPVRTEIMQVCDMCIQLNSLKLQYDFEEQETITRIYNYTENALQSFVSGRNFLNRAYQKSQRKEYSVFLLSYINNR